MNNAFKIYSGDYSKDGYDSGIDDAKHHKPKNKFKFFKAVSPINYVWAFDNAYQSFMGNYDKAYGEDDEMPIVCLDSFIIVSEIFK